MSAIAQFLRRTPAAAFIGDIAKWMRDPRTMRRLMADVRATRTEAAFMRTVPEPTAGARQLHEQLVMRVCSHAHGKEARP